MYTDDRFSLDLESDVSKFPAPGNFWYCITWQSAPLVDLGRHGITLEPAALFTRLNGAQRVAKNIGVHPQFRIGLPITRHNKFDVQEIFVYFVAMSTKENSRTRLIKFMGITTKWVCAAQALWEDWSDCPGRVSPVPEQELF